MNTIEQVEELRKKQLSFFSSGKTRDIRFRRESLRRLRDSIVKRDKEIRDALKKDLNRMYGDDAIENNDYPKIISVILIQKKNPWQSIIFQLTKRSRTV